MRTCCDCRGPMAVALSVVMLFLSGFSARAGIIPSAQNRAIDVDASASALQRTSDEQQDHAAAPDFGLFDRALSLTANASDGPPPSAATGRAASHQRSEILPLSVTADADYSIGATASGLAGGGGIAHPYFILSFNLEADYPYSLQLALDRDQTTLGAQGLVYLSGPAGDVARLDLPWDAAASHESITRNGILPAGGYLLFAEMLAGVSVGGPDPADASGTGGFSIRLALVPEPSTAMLLMASIGAATLRRWRGRSR